LAEGSGSTWVAEDSGTDADLYGVWGDGAGVVVAVGTRGTILRRLSGAWVVAKSEVIEPLFCVGGRPADLWAAGGAGTILHSLDAGQDWAKVPDVDTRW